MSRQPAGTRNTPLSRPDTLSRQAGSAWKTLLLPLLCFCVLFFCLPAPSATLTDRDPAFEKYPVDKWLRENHQPHLRWRVDIPPAELSTHQRLIVKVITHIDGRELEKRRGEGEFLVLLQYQDPSGRLWQHHAGLDLGKIQPGAKSSEYLITNFAFILPGDYTVTVAVIDTHSGEHNSAVRKIHVAGLKTEHLPNAWAGLPPIEFIAPTVETPDVWYLPDIQTRLNLALNTNHPVHIQVVVNTTPSESASGSAYTMRRNMSLLIPALKILSQIDVRNGSVDVAFLDLTRRRVPFEQKNVHVTDWDRARQYFLHTNPGIIDVQALQGHWKMRSFFEDEITRRLRPPETDGAVPIVIVLSGPAFLEDQESAGPVPTASADQHLFYIRYRALPVRPRVRPRPGMRPPAPPRVFNAMPVDDLERTVEPLGAHLFDAASAEQFRRVLAAILEHISQM